jgi:hypothetical protein
MKQLLLISVLFTMLLINNSTSAQNTFPSSGNVGIGTLSPTGLLDVRGDAFVNGVRVGTGPTNDTTCVVLGRNAFSNLTPGGSSNTAIGCNSLFSTSGFIAGFSNVAVGFKTLYANTRGYSNTAVGSYALLSNITGTNNVAVGRDAISANTAGEFNSALGVGSMFNLTSGSSNTAIGTSAMGAIRIGNNNIAIGTSALYGLGGVGTNCEYNVSIGNNSMLTNLTGSYNTATGSFALDSNTTGISNSAYGYYSMHSNKSGMYNTASGAYALYKNNSGLYNSGIGQGAVYYNVSGNANSGIGYFASPNAGALFNTTSLGYFATTTASNQVRLGSTAVTSIGGYVNWTNISDGRIKINVQENVPGLDFINQLKPVTYNLDLDAAEKLTGVNLKDIDKKALQEHKKEKAAKEQLTYTGFIAQDVEKAAQATKFDFSGVDVPKNDKDLYGLRYAEFVVPLVKAVQELSKQNEILKNKIEKLEAANAAKQDPSLNQTVSITTASLLQNIPNPFKGSTSIGYTLPEKTSKAQIVITDQQGKRIKTIPVSGSNGNITLNTSELSAGTYQYSLYVNDRMVESRQMIVRK